MPRQDLEWLFQFKGSTPESALAMLGAMEPTSNFGELFQYSNSMAGAAGFVAGHVSYPKLELGAAYDRAMQTEVFGPLGMASTTFDYARALHGNHATAHSLDIDGKPAKGAMELNYAIVSLRPAGAAWSNVNDMLKYVQMELDEGTVKGKPYVSRDALLARRKPQVAIGKDASYGMGLITDTTWGIPVIHHGGDLLGYHSDMIWIPDQKVGAVILTNGDLGPILRNALRRKLLEVLFDGKPEADENVASAAKTFRENLAAERKLLTIPADPDAVAKLATGYQNAALGDVDVKRAAGKVTFDVGEWQSEVVTKKNPDGTISFITIRPGIDGLDFVVGTAGTKRTLTLRDGQHDYVFSEKD
jgi:CubicO group peptidase (beta-lactamase class C family)